MTIVSKMAVLALGSCIALASNSAMAQFAASAQISQTGWRLVDLDANDGVTPSVTFYDVYTRAASTFNGEVDGLSWESKEGHSFDPLQAHASYSNNDATSSFSDGNLLSVGRINQAGWLYSYQIVNASFTLTPHTRFEYFGLASGYAKNEGSSEIGDSASANAFAHSTISASLVAEGQTGGWNSDPNKFFSRYVSVDGRPSQEEFSQQFTLSFENKGAVARNAKLELDSQLQGVRPLSAVPEPETYAMMLGGLAALGALARRRQSKKMA